MINLIELLIRKGCFDDYDSLQKCFRYYQGRVSAMIGRFQDSGRNSNSLEIEKDIYDNCLSNHSYFDLSTFYCWLEWKDSYQTYPWLTKFAITNPNQESRNHRTKSTSSLDSFSKMMVGSIDKFTEILKPETIFFEKLNSEIEERKIDTYIDSINSLLNDPHTSEDEKDRLMQLRAQFVEKRINSFRQVLQNNL